MSELQSSMNERPVLSAVAVLVTYGTRWAFLREVLGELLRGQPEIAKVVLVDNAAEYDLMGRLLSEGFDSVRVVSMGENAGSAAGFAAGIAVALDESEAEMVWLLDDDNKPGKASLKTLLSKYVDMGADPQNTLLALRKTRPEQVESLDGRRRLFVRPNSFFGFHLSEIPEKLLRRGRRQESARSDDGNWPLSVVGYAPYGGFLFHRSWIDRVGLPDRRFFLYGDDHEFTARIVTAGGRILLCGSAEVIDLEVSWALQGRRAPALLSKDSSPMRVFYTVRNRVFWEINAHTSARLVYLVNVVLYLGLLMTRALVAERSPKSLLGRLRLVCRAFAEGARGKLGKVGPF